MTNIDFSDFEFRDPYQRCLNICEKIISSLSDKSIVTQYFATKEKIQQRISNKNYSQITPKQIDTDRAYQSYQKFIEENRQLKEQLATLQSQKPDFSQSPDNMDIAKILRNLQNQILQQAKPAPISNAIVELDNLRMVVDAKLEALNYMRTQLKEKNTKLKRELEELTATLTNKLEAAKEKAQMDGLEIAAADRNLDSNIEEAEKKLEALKIQLENAKAENSRLMKQHSSSTALLDQMVRDTETTEQEIEQMENESESLFKEIEKLRNQLNVKEKELGSLRTLEKFGVDAGRSFDITDEIQRLKEKAATLRSENAQMSFELKRMEKKSNETICEPATYGSIDEDELAAHIFRSKFQ